MLLTVVFFFALTGTVYFFGKLITWHASIVAPHNFKKEMTRKQILMYNLIGLTSAVLWSVVFYYCHLF